MQPARLKKRPEEPAGGPHEPETGRRQRAPRPRSKVGRLLRFVLVLLCLVALPWAGLATWWLYQERAALAAQREEQAFLQKSYEEKLRVMTRRLVSAIATQQAGGQGQGSVGEGADDRLADLIAKQVELETRQTLLGGLTGQAIAPILPGGGAQAPANGIDFAGGEALLDRLDPTRSSPQRRQIAALNRAGEKLPLQERLAVLEQSLGRVDLEQGRQLSTLGRHLVGRVQEIRAALSELGLDVAKVKLPPAQSAMGGPLVPLSVAMRPGSFEYGLKQLDETRLAYGRWRDLATIVPLRRPLDGDDSTTSNFGTRTDPFTGASAMHAGMDFRAETGTPVHAPGAGKVLRAEVAGGYGNLIELDHGNGLTTRYGHLSAFDVKPGQIVAAGTIIGRIGSTGRSTGPHLHYETRHDDEALNPLKFIQVGARLSQGFNPGAPLR
ncbi:M23 family peptidase [Bosea caraganae]|uniref:M23 family peptidase n=1 Tax=Bosea caraganae TaxID=2763117 RepID=A0A370L7Q0_9HYPH|nr:M23 family metallopeptidase [Bosea caraganae]RDJ24956.1 M23 family peptidase [Bosea caraganae]RDJ26067.1 M23 family peptidase [Bosea caraganae]